MGCKIAMPTPFFCLAVAVTGGVLMLSTGHAQDEDSAYQEALSRILPAEYHAETGPLPPDERAGLIEDLDRARQDYWKRLGALPAPGPLEPEIRV